MRARTSVPLKSKSVYRNRRRATFGLWALVSVFLIGGSSIAASMYWAAAVGRHQPVRSPDLQAEAPTIALPGFRPDANGGPSIGLLIGGAATVPERLSQGQGLPFVDDPNAPLAITTIDPAGEAEPQDVYHEWTPTESGTHFVRVNDGLQTMLFSIEADAHDRHGCIPCADREAELELRGVRVVIPLGTTTDGKQAGALWIEQEEPSSSLIDATSVRFNLDPDDVTVTPTTGDDFEVATPDLTAEVVTINAYTIEIRLLDLLDQVYRKWVITDPDGSGTHNDVHLTEYVDDGGGLEIVAKYEYDALGSGDRDWTLTTKDPAGTTLQIEEETWEDLPTDPNEPAMRERRYVRKAPNGTVVYHANTQYTEFGWGWRPTQEIVDPNTGGANLTTTWTYIDDPQTGLRVDSIQRADGSWTRYQYDLTGDLVIQEIHGWKDEDFSTDPNLPAAAAGVRGIERVYNDTDDFRLASEKEWIDGDLVRATSHTHAAHNPSGRLASTTSAAWLDPAPTATLSTLTYFLDEDDERIDYVVYPDGRRDEHTYVDAISFTPGTPPSYSLTPDPNAVDTGYRYREVTHGYSNGGSLALLTGKSMRETTIRDAAGRTVFSESWVYDGSSWARVDWTSQEYDADGRPTDTDHADGTSRSIAYTSCCGQTVTDSQGVETTTTRDALGRVEQVIRGAVATGGGYPAQAAVTTSYDYSVPFETEITVSDGTLSQTSVRTVDAAGRLVSEETANGVGDLKTLYEYGFTAEGGRKVTVYRDYAISASSGTAGVRDRVTAYYRDGQTKSVTGSTVVAEYHHHDAAPGERSTLVSQVTNVTGTPGAGDRYTKTTHDMLGRVKTEQRPGWIASGTATLTTTYHYDASGSDAGLLKRVQRSHAADTLYAYDELGNAIYTALDADDDGTIDYAGSDRVTHTERQYEFLDSAWWRVNLRWVLPAAGDDDEVLVSEVREKAPDYLASGTIRETKSFDASGNVTATTTELLANHRTAEETDTPGSATDAQRVWHGDRLMLDVTSEGVITEYSYDGLGRRTHVTDSRDNATETHYDAGGRVDWTEDEAGHRTTFAYYGDTASHPGRIQYAEVPDVTGSTDKRTYFEYNDRGQTTRTWGDVPYPTETVYNSYGERTQLKTYRSGSSWSASTWASASSGATADTTTWTIDAATGLVEAKTYSDNSSVTYTYTTAGDVLVRTWARTVGGNPLTTTYSYNDGTGGTPYTGERIKADYSDGTIDVQYHFDRLGRMDWVKDAVGTREFAYDGATLALTEEEFVVDAGTPDLLDGFLISRLYEDGTETNGLEGRFKGFQLGTSADPDAEYEALYAYDATGRFGTVTGPGVSDGAVYTYRNDHPLLVDKLAIKNSGGTTVGEVVRTYDADHDLLASIENKWNSGGGLATVSKYAYRYDARHRRTDVVYSGSAFGGAGNEQLDLWEHNDRNELTGANRHDGDDPDDPNSEDTDLRRAYLYDPIGNRTDYDEGDPNSGGTAFDYVRTALNQYTRINGGPAGMGLQHDADGNRTHMYAAADVNHDGSINITDLGLVNAAMNTCSGEPGYDPDADIDGSGCVNITDQGYVLALFSTPSNAVELTWDAENRLVGYEPILPADGDLKLAFVYDYLGRRVEKQVFEYDAGDPNDPNDDAWGSTPITHRKFVWYDWLMIAELDGSTNDAMRLYSWGLDLAGQSGTLNSLQQVGGIGGLLATRNLAESPNRSYVHFYDGNGNTSQLVKRSDGSVAASYEYDAYGNVVGPASPGGFASTNTWRFSTKYFDDETGLGYWNLRYYRPAEGRWINRDPIGEAGGANLYVYVNNLPTLVLDPFGDLASCGGPVSCGGGSPEDAPTGSPPSPPPIPPCPAGEVEFNGGCISDDVLPQTPTPPQRRPNDPTVPITKPPCTSPVNKYGFDWTCANHDQCYGTIGKSRDACDKEWFADMILHCITMVPPGQVGDCLQQAEGMYGWVVFLGQSFYDRAQRESIERWKIIIGSGGPLF